MDDTDALIYSERIISSAASIDKSLVQTKGQAFVDRMKESLPRLPEVGSHIEQNDTADQTEEALVKICKSIGDNPAELIIRKTKIGPQRSGSSIAICQLSKQIDHLRTGMRTANNYRRLKAW